MDDPKEMSDEELFEALRPESLTRDAWAQIQRMANQRIMAGEKVHAKASVMAYFDWIEMVSKSFECH